MLDAISHIALIVKDSNRISTLFKDLFGSSVAVRKEIDGHEETLI